MTKRPYRVGLPYVFATVVSHLQKYWQVRCFSNGHKVICPNAWNVQSSMAVRIINLLKSLIHTATVFTEMETRGFGINIDHEEFLSLQYIICDNYSSVGKHVTKIIIPNTISIACTSIKFFTIMDHFLVVSTTFHSPMRHPHRICANHVLCYNPGQNTLGHPAPPFNVGYKIAV